MKDNNGIDFWRISGDIYRQGWHETYAMQCMAQEKAYLGSPDNPGTAAVVCYITIIGWLIAYFGLYKNKKSSIAAVHLRQSLLLHLLFFILNVLSILALWGRLSYVIVAAGGILLFILWLTGAFRAINGVERPIPIVGNLAQEMFGKI